MSKTIDDAIAEIQRMIREYEVDLAALIRAKQRMTGGVPAPRPTMKSARLAGRRHGRRRHVPIKPTSSVGLTEKILKESGSPLHIDKVLDQIEGRTGTRPKKASLVGSLSQNVRDGKIFTREGPNTFGLLEWRHGKRGD